MIRPWGLIVWSLRREWRYLSLAIDVCCYFMIVIGFGGHVQAYFFPVRTRSVVSNVFLQSPTRLCWTFDFAKGWGEIIHAATRVYVDGSPHGFISGIEHEDGTPFGSSLDGKPGAKIVTECVHLPALAHEANSIHIVMETAYKSWQPWIIPQADVLIDWRK